MLQWHNYLEGLTHAMLVLSDHKNLEYFQPQSSSPDNKSVGLNTFPGSTTTGPQAVLYRTTGTEPDALTCHKDIDPQTPLWQGLSDSVTQKSCRRMSASR